MKIEDLTEIEGQISLDDLMKQTETPRYGFRGCAGCTWYRLDKDGNRRCYWAITKDRAYRPKADYIYPHCDDNSPHFEPCAYKVPRMCGNCKYCNQFVYENKEEYGTAYTRAAADDPKETPNIYCTHPQGSLNRRTAYKDLEWAGFGVGHYDRQHEWDTCDRWELDQGGYRTFSFTKEQMENKGADNDT
ncbi:hypothetical protein IKF15_00620 [Candidatus Saccharibacteria bacterium]|nr:hypothetical protein [Candidatus Saccharibacteria bacterium]